MRCDGDRCVALAGTLGVDVYCKVYEHRPLVCAEFAAGSDACLEVRRQFGFDDDDAAPENDADGQ